MKKKFLKTVAFLMAAVLVFTLTACGVEKDTGENDVNSLTYWVPMPSDLATRVSSFNEISMYKKREADTGIHINFVHPPNDQAAEQFKLMIASGDLPDIIEYNWSAYTGGLQQAIKDGIVLPLNDYLDYAPNFKAALEKGELAENYRRGSTTDDGYLYGFTTLNIGEYRIFGGPLIRRDWLNKIGMEIPETIDEWTAVLTAFKEKLNVPTPLTGAGAPSHFVGAFGIGSGWYVDNDIIKYGPAQPEFKGYLQTMHDWYEKGLLDRDIATNTTELKDSKILKGQAGALTVGNIGGSIGKYLKQKETEDPSYDIVGAPFPVLEKGTVNRFAIPNALDVNKTRTAVITTACKNPEVAIKWLDYLYSDEGYMLSNFGVEGEDYTLVDGKPVYSDFILHNPEGLSISSAIKLCCRATEPFPGLNQAPEYLEQYYEYPQQTETLKRWVANTAETKKSSLPALSSQGDEADLVASIKADLDTYSEEMLWAFITGKESLDKFDEYIDNINKKFRCKELQAIYQKQYERYLKR